VEVQDSAYPYHDWNERITVECYAPNAASRIFDAEGKIIDIVNNYSKISFNFGPTLLSWLERHRPDVHQGIIDADRLSRDRFSGHGSAIAQVYNHMIMPLANRRDKITQVLWGIRDFVRRFDRFPEGMWLPETAVDIKTLEVLAENGIAFTVLAPQQAGKTRQIGEKEWRSVQGGHVDPTMAYLCRLPSGRTINLFFYDGPISGDIAFGGLLESGETFANRLAGAFSQRRDWSQIVHIATDGETYGHHHYMGDMALAYCLDLIEAESMGRVTIYGEFLEKHPPTHEVEIVEKSSWSCIHGIERWRDNCGCHSGMHPGWVQTWRKPLRDAMERLRDWLGPFFELEASKYLKSPWEARNDYIEVILDRTRENVDAFLSRHAVRSLSGEEKSRVLRLMEMQRYSMLTFTSCGWFFDEVSGLETTQVMQYAARAIQLAEEVWGVRLENFFLEILEEAQSNIPGISSAARAYEMYVKPSSIDLLRVGAHYASSAIFREPGEEARISHIYCYAAEDESYRSLEEGPTRLGLGRVRVVSDITLDESALSFATLYRGGHELVCGVKESMGESVFRAMSREIEKAFKDRDVPLVVRAIDKHFGDHRYTLRHLFRDEQHKILNILLRGEMEETEAAFSRIIERNYSMIGFLNEIQMPVPKPLAFMAEFVLNMKFQKIFEQEEPDLNSLEKLIDELGKLHVTLDNTALEFVSGKRINELFNRVSGRPEDISLLERIERFFVLLSGMNLDLNLWRAQNMYFALAKELSPKISAGAGKGDPLAQRWLEVFRKLSDHLHVKIGV
jgi:alpha-amylase/alpha-mannosidase (GH57 family)